MKNDRLKELSKEELIHLIELYSKNWLAMDGLWFQSVEKEAGMDQAMLHDERVWESFTVIEAKRIKEFLRLDDHPGLDGLEKALKLRLYANLSEDMIEYSGDTLIYTMTDCRVQTARKRKGMPSHPCRSVGEIEYGNFAKTIDDRIDCRCISCFPDITDDSCCCKWEFTIEG